MSELYSIVVKATDGTVAGKAFDDEHTRIAIASRGKHACVFTESLPEELQQFKQDPEELRKRVSHILNDNSIEIHIRPMLSVHINGDGNYVMNLCGKSSILDGNHPELAARLTAYKLRGSRTKKQMKLFGKRV